MTDPTDPHRGSVQPGPESFVDARGRRHKVVPGGGRDALEAREELEAGRRSVPIEPEDLPFPEAGPGTELDQYSPAGQVAAWGQLLQGLQRRWRRRRGQESSPA